jgi:tetratricopeptide (TPR) repeat protein
VNLLIQGALFLTLPLYAVDPSQPAPPGTISADLLRQHLPSKARALLQKAQRAADAGDHAGAIELLESTLVRYPESAAWTQSMLGVEYLKTRQFDAAVTALEQAVALLPHEAVDHSNLGFALASTGHYDQAEQELRRAAELDSGNLKIRALLATVHQRNAPLTSSLR